MAGDLDAGFRGLVEGLVAAGQLTEPVTGVIPGELIATGGPPAQADDTPLRVLVVDDRPELRESLQALLDGEGGWRTQLAADGQEALDRLDQDGADIVLLDLIMPGLSGLEVIDRVAEAGIDTRIIVVSGEPTFEHVQRALTHGAVDFIRKPYEPGELLSTLARVRDALLLERRAREMEHRLLRSELLHRFVVDSSPDLVYMLDSDGRFAFLNHRAETLLGIPREELLGEHYEVLIPASERVTAEFLFDAHETGERVTRDAELLLLSRIPRGSDPRENLAPVAVTAMSIHADQGSGPGRRRIGTYGVIRDLSEQKRAEALIRFQTWHDQLTRLPNRSLFRDRVDVAVARARREGSLVAVMYLDLDRFKVINDTLGHSVGDRLLKAVAARLGSLIQEGDTLARFGGDEFGLLLPDVRSEEDVDAVAGKLLEGLAVPFQVDEHELYVAASIGIAVHPEAGDSAESLIRGADIAMYHIKARGKNGHQRFAPRMDDARSLQLSVDRELRNALLSDELEPYFQPQVDVETGEVVGVEALARWNHPQRGLVNPADFIPLAEETGLIIPVDQCIQRKACTAVAAWRAEGYPGLSLSMNLSAAQIQSADFVDSMLAMLEETGIGTGGIKLEITEGAIIREMDLIIPRLRRLAAHGVRIGIDDFGTGYSSLSWLQNFPVNTLKIDRSFVSDIRSDQSESSIVNAIIHMARGLGMEIIAEGVENEPQLRYLHVQGCRQVQGFLYSRPMSRVDLPGYLDGGTDSRTWLADAGQAPGRLAVS